MFGPRPIIPVFLQHLLMLFFQLQIYYSSGTYTRECSRTMYIDIPVVIRCILLSPKLSNDMLAFINRMAFEKKLSSQVLDLHSDAFFSCKTHSQYILHRLHAFSIAVVCIRVKVLCLVTVSVLLCCYRSIF